MAIVEKLLEEILAKIEKVDAELDALCGLVDMMPYFGLFMAIFSFIFSLIAGLTVGRKLKWRNGEIGGKRAIRTSLLLGLITGVSINLYVGEKFADANEKVTPILNASAEIAYTANKLTKKTYVPAKIEKLISDSVGRLDEELKNSRLTCVIAPESRIEKTHNETMASLGKFALAPAMMYTYREELDEVPLWVTLLIVFLAAATPILSFSGFFIFLSLIINWALFPSAEDPPSPPKTEASEPIDKKDAETATPQSNQPPAEEEDEWDPDLGPDLRKEWIKLPEIPEDW